MEESDDLSSGPNEDGELNLSYYDWQEIPDVIHEQYRSQLYKLSLSHNRLLRISHQIGKLTLLKDLDLSYNNIQFVDASIGNCIRLRKLNLSNNHIETLPNEILNCVMIDTLLLNHNRLTSLPLNFYFPALERLDVGNNDLRSIPVQLCSIESLRIINCGENPNLSMIPTDMQSDSELVLWVLRMHQSFEFEIDSRTKDYYDVEEITKQTHDEKMQLMQEVEDIGRRAHHLKCERPLKYIELKLKVHHFFSNLKEKFSNSFSFLKREMVANKIYPRIDI
mmetsp:Transcript_3388/g.6330  ORF Transcript_3388/g.6330 Transcript_3388/m.6330 type:complete len:279 (-) Transcript_3388:1231-2067(-)